MKNEELGMKNWELRIENEELGIKNEELGMKNWEWRIENEELGMKNWELRTGWLKQIKHLKRMRVEVASPYNIYVSQLKNAWRIFYSKHFP